ncbi:MAG: DUF4175 family protein [candidate division Zixibacteria bacterium]|nr:DUF4175 family protein [candidate division Zixibacteria bacterium]
MNPKESLRYLTGRLKSLRNYILLKNLAVGAAIIVTAMAALLLVGWLFNLLFWLTPDFRTSFMVIAALALVGLFIYRILLRILRQPSTEKVALQVEKRYPHLKNQLIASLQLEKNLHENREGFSTEMIKAVIESSKHICHDLDFKESVSWLPLRRWSKYLAVAAGVVLIIGFLFPGSFNESVYLYSHPFLEIERELSYQLEVSPGNCEIAKFTELDIEALVFGSHLPDEALLYWRYPGGKLKQVELNRRKHQAGYAAGLSDKFGLSDSLRFSHIVRETKRSFEYWVVAGEITSTKYLITVVDKPRVIGLKLTYHYPRYTGLDPLVVDENDGNIAAIKGTNVMITASLNKPVKEAWLQFTDSSTQQLKIERQRLTATIKVIENGSYHIEVIDSLGHGNVKPIEYRIEKIADLYPEVDIFSPGVPVDLDDRMALDLGMKLFDDFGFSEINLLYQLHSPTGESFEVKNRLGFDRKLGRDFELRHPWDLANIGLEPGGFVEYFIEAYDNDNISGPKRGVSQILTARLPSLDEMFAYLEDEEQEQISALEQLHQQQQQLAEQMAELSEELLTNQELDWEQRKNIEKALMSQQELMQAMENIAERMQQMEDEMRKNDLTSLEILQKLQEIKKLFEEVATPEMREAMRRLQEALQRMDPQELQDAADKMQMSQEELKERLERTIALLKLLQIQQKMENMVKLLEQLIERQQQVNEATKQSEEEKLPDLAPREKENKAKFDDLQEQAKELEELLKEINLADNQAAQDFCHAPSESPAGEEMEEMAENLAKSRQSQSMQRGEAALSALNELQKRMQESKDSFNTGMGMQSVEEMKGAFDDLLYLSDQQENIFNFSEQVDPKSSQLATMAAQQQALARTLESLREKLIEIAKGCAFYKREITDLIDQAGECMGSSTTNLMNRNGAAAGRYQKEAMLSLNQAANRLLQSMQSQKMCSSGSCSKQNMFKKMNKLSQQQQKINNNSSAMCNNPSQGKRGKDALRRLANEQAAVQKSLEELQQEQGGRRDILGRLDEMAREVRKVVEDLESGHLDENTLDRQYKIHSRMLDFQRSLERQDYKEERVSETGRNLTRTSPLPLRFDTPETRDTYQDRLQKYLQEKFPEEYEEIVKEYFRAVNNNQDNR